MAKFMAMGSAGGAGATITVTYSSEFYDKTITCSDGTTTYTKITTSSGSTEFKVKDEGTWTITCDGTSRTVNVILNYSTVLSITKTVTVYSAASDTVSFTDYTGAKTVTTDTSGVGSVAITFMPPSANITFTSSVAKNPTDQSSYYSKQIVIDSSTTVIYVIPNNTLYWYGNECSWITGGWSQDGYQYGSYPNTNGINKATNYITLTKPTQGTNANSIIGMVNSIALDDYSSVKAVAYKGSTLVTGMTVDVSARTGAGYVALAVSSYSNQYWANYLDVFLTNKTGTPLNWNDHSSSPSAMNVYAVFIE